MKKRALSWLLALTMLLTLAPQTLPVWASAEESSTSGSKTESKLSSNTYSALGLSRDVDPKAQGLDDEKQPYGKAKVGNTVATNVINELYVNFNGSIHYGWSILDKLTMEYKTGISDWTSSDNFYGAMGYWRPGQQTVHYKNGDKSAGALFAEDGVAGEHNGKSSINSANKHLTYQYSKSEAFSPNTGKDNYVAEMTIDSASQVYLYIYQVEGGNKRYVRSTKVCDASESGGGANDKTNIIYNWEYDAMCDIAAGDMDGDGYDEIAVYAQNKVYVYSFVKGVLSSPIEKTTVAPSDVNENNGKYKKLKTAVVTLAFGDLNADDKDELVIAENIGYGSSKIADGKVGIYSLTSAKKLHEEKIISLKYDDSMMVRYANVATGDIDKDYKDELIIAGYISADVFGQTIVGKDNIAYRVVDGTDTGYTVGDWKTTSFVKKELLGRVVDNANQLIPPVALTCAATQGVGHAEQIFLAGCLYSYSSNDGNLTKLTEMSTNREYKKDNGNKANKEEIFVVNVVAGNFNGNRNGQEQIVYAFGMKHDDSDRYWYDIGYINKKNPGSDDAGDTTAYWYGQEQVMNYESSYNRDSSKARASLYLSLAAVDCDNDSTLMRYKGQTVTWTKPEVLTILQSAPYFQDLEDTRGYLDQGQTGYGKGSSSSSSAIAGTSLKVGTYVSFEQDFSVFGVKVASIEAEAQSTHEFEYEFQSTKEKSIEVRYSGSAGDDYAVIYAVPYMEYQYETWVPGYTLQGGNYAKYLNTYLSQKLGKAESAITEEEREKAAKELGVTQNTTVEGSWQPSSVMVPMKPATVLITVDDYDAIAEQTEGLEPIRGNILNSTPGEPATYDKINSRRTFTKIGAQQRVTTAEGGNVSLEATTTDTTEHTFAYNYEFEAKAGAGAGGVTVGVLAGLGTTAGGGVSSSKSSSYSATVDNLPKDASKYGFSWQFGYREAKLNNNDVLVLEYQLDNVAQLPSMPKNLRVDSVTSNSVTLKWDKVTGAGAYKIYQRTSDNRIRLIATVPGTAESYTDTNVNPNNTYTYCVQNVSQVGGESIYSTEVKAITLTDANGNFVIKQQPKDLTTYVGGTDQTTVEAEYLKNGQPQNLNYYWDRYNTETKKWEDYSQGSPTLSVSVTEVTVDGTKYRCQVYYDSNLYIYTDPVTLTIGKANSKTDLSSAQAGQTVNASYVEKKEVTSETEKKTVPHEEKIGGETYLMYTKGNDITVYMKDGKYYSKNGNTANLITEEEENVQLTYIVKTTTPATEDEPATETVEEKNILFSKMEKDGAFNASEAKVTYVYQAEPKNTSGDASDGSTGSTDSESETVTYTATEKYTVKDSTVVVYHSYTSAQGEGTSAIDFWFVQSGDKKYAADVQTATKLVINNTTKVDVNDLVQVEDEVPVVKTEETYKEGEKVTLTATPSDPSQSGLKLSGKVVFKIVNSIGDGSKTVDATIGNNGTATAEWIPTAAGVYTITAAYEGNEKYMGSVSGQTITINVVVPEQKTLMIDSPNSMTYGDAAIELKTTLLKGAKNSESASVETNLNGVTYSVKEIGATISSDGKFTPTAAGTYTVTATYTSDSETLTATKSIVVNKRTVTIVPKVDKDTKNTSFEPVGIANDTDKALFSLKTKQNQTGNVDISCAGINTTAAGEYRITVTYTATPEIDKNYIVVCDNTQVYEIKDNVVKVTNATNNSNGSVELKYSLKDSNDLVSVYGTSMDIPKNAKLIAVASPKRGYRVEKWTEKVGEAQEDTIFSSGNVYETSNTITIPSGKLQTDKYSIRADFTEVYYNLTIGFQPDKTGSIEAYYLTDDGMKGDTFYSSTSPSLTPTTAIKQLSPLKKVRITATPAEGQVISGWRIYSGDNDRTGTLVENNGTIYTGNTYTVSSINANTKIEIQTETKAAKTIKVTLVGQDGANLGSQASVSFNGGAATISEDGNYTYSTAQHDNVVINLTVPDSLIVDSWKIGDTEQNVGTLSNNKKTLSISDLQLTADSLDLTVHCKAPNSYPVKVEQKVGETTVTGADALPATITIKKNGTNAEVDSTNPSVPEATILRVIIQEKEGYELQSVSCNGREQTTQDTQGGKAFTIDGVHADVNIVATFVKLDEYTVTFFVVDTNGEEAGGENGELKAAVDRNGIVGYQNDNFTTGNIVYEGSKITFTATPAEGYRVKEWRVGTEVYRPDGSTTDFIEERLTLDAVEAAKGVTVQFTPIGNKVIIQAEGQGTITSARVGSTEQLGNISEGFVLQGGSAVTITAAPSQGYEVMHWIVNGKIVSGTENQNRYTYSAKTNSSGALIKAVFQPVNYTVRWSGENGTVTKTDGETTKEAQVRGGTSIIFHAAPDNGYVLSGWTVNGKTVENATNPDFTWSVPLGKPAAQQYEIKAIFQRNATPLTVTYQVEGSVGGTIATANGQNASVSVVYGGDVTFTAEPDEYYSVKEWKVGSNTVPNSDNKSEYTLQNVTEDTMVTVVFQKALSFTVGYEAGQNGTIQAKENGQSLQLETEHTKEIPGGSTLEFKAVPATGSPNYMVAKWTVNNVEVTKDNMSTLGVTMEQGHPLSNTLTIENLSRNVVVKAEFVEYTNVAVPSAGTGYVIQDVQRVPAETYANAPTNEIRKNGDLTFTVKPNGKDQYITIGTLIVNGYDCIANKATTAGLDTQKCDSVSAKKNDDGSYTVTITNVKDEVEKTIVAHQVIVGGLTVPAAFAGKEELNSAEKIRTKLEASFTGSKDGMAFYDIALKYYNGTQWVDVDGTNFPANGVDVVLPYPTGTDKQDRFQIVHMLTHSGHEGEIERITASNETDGLHFHVNSLSPFGVSWTKYVAPTPGGGGGGGGAVSTYTLTFDTNGGSAIDKITKDSGTTIDLTAYKPTRTGYTFAGWFSDKALTKAVTSVKLTANTTVYAKWTQNGGTAQNPFVDVKEGAYYYDAVLWAVEQKITSGTSATTFSPDASCTRAQMVTFLWRAAGSPKVENGKNPFTDVQADAYYYDAVLWAVEKGVTSGTSATTFSPDATVTRGQTVTFLYRNAGSPEVSGTMPFTDVEADAYYAKAVDWASAKGIVAGYSETQFGPEDTITREQLAVILNRYATYKGYNTSKTADLAAFQDADQISEWARVPVQWANVMKLLNGRTSTTLAPKGSATRAEVAKILVTFLDTVKR